MTRYEYVKTVLEPRFKDEDELYHYGTPRHSGRYPYGSGKRPYQGILGMKWGVRRYQNEDGSLTPEGERRYSMRVVPRGWRPPMPMEQYDVIDNDGTFISYKKRTKKELEEYDKQQERKKKIANEINNPQKASDRYDFMDKVSIRLWNDPEIIPLSQERYKLNKQLNASKDPKEQDELYEQISKIEDQVAKKMEKYRSDDISDAEAREIIADTYLM